jgi:hypothetical protein
MFEDDNANNDDDMFEFEEPSSLSAKSAVSKTIETGPMKR